MNDKLELINNLRLEVEDLTQSRDAAKIKQYDCLQEIENAEDEIDTMEDKWSNDIDSFENAWKKKLRIQQIPIYIIIALISVYGFIKNNIGIADFLLSSLILEIAIAVYFETGMDVFDIYFNYQNKHQQRVVNRLRKYLFKKYPHIEKMYNDLSSLAEEIQTKRKHLQELKIEEQELQNKLREICNLLSSKKDELIALEREYIDIVSSNNIANEIDTDPIITEGKGKTRVRRIEDN